MTIKIPHFNDNYYQSGSYNKWLEEQFDVNIVQEKNRYDVISKSIQLQVLKSRFWKRLLRTLQEWHHEYHTIQHYPLFNEPIPDPIIVRKRWKNFFTKTFRENREKLDNNPILSGNPNIDLITPANWFKEINDIVRTRMIVKYIDGVGFLIDKIKELCLIYNIKYKVEMKSTQEGYYAGHIYLFREYRVPDMGFNHSRINVPIEIQVSTLLQDIIYKLLHTYYEENRLLDNKIRYDWQWKFTAKEFSTNYLGHILHYLEGQIYNVRNKQSNLKGEDHGSNSN